MSADLQMPVSLTACAGGGSSGGAGAGAGGGGGSGIFAAIIIAMLGAAIVLPLYRLDKMYPPLTADLQEQEKHRPLSD